ncbi:MAG: GMC family oxidoreductase [Actinobacteria bacterium]|nr:GMC family oxidoreductase [Actinomycetota bacterium]
MAKEKNRLEADVVIAGSGPGGCAIALDLSKRGKKVIMLEKGMDNKLLFGNPLGMITHSDFRVRLPMPVRKTIEGEDLILGNGVGGGTLMYAGSAFLPDLPYWEEVGIEIPQDIIEETVKDTWATLPPDEFIGQGTRRVWTVAKELGYPFEKCMRHVDFEKCVPGCEICCEGCPPKRDAKWTGAVMAHEAEEHGTTILTNVKVNHITIDNGKATGVKARGILGKRGEDYEVYAPMVICAAGGVGTAMILKNSGFPRAGNWFAGDPTTFIFGFLPPGQRGNGGEHNMTVGFYDEEHHIVFCAMLSPYIAWHLQYVGSEGVKALSKLTKWRRGLGLFAKVSDHGVGRVFADGKVSNTFTDADWDRIEYGRSVGREILVKAGCDPYDIHTTPLTLGHPSATVRVGELIDSNLESKDVKNLFCCDTSITPGAPGRPPALTITALGRRLARYLTENKRV